MPLSEEEIALCDIITLDARYLTLSEIEEDIALMCCRNEWELIKYQEKKNVLFAYKIVASEGGNSVSYLVEYLHHSRGNRLICHASDTEVSLLQKKGSQRALQKRRELLRCVYKEMLKLYNIL